jgi:hypothetical protein
MGWNNREILLKIKCMKTECWLIQKLKWFLTQFIKKYQSQYRYLGQYLDRFLKNYFCLFNW